MKHVFTFTTFTTSTDSLQQMLIAIALCAGSFSMQAQELLSDQISLEPGYTDMVFYSFSEGQTGTAEQAAWDLAFDITEMGTGIRINGGVGAELFLYGTSEQWDVVDTTGWAQTETLRNESSSWDMGAFNQGGDGMFDLGWGVYDVVTHVVAGDKIYLYYAPDGSVKKVQIQNLDLGIYSFRFADLEGTNLVEMTLDKADYPGRNMVYLNLATAELLDLEPMDWDVMFFRYMENIGNEVFYSVVGGLVNRGVEVQELSGLLYPMTDETFGTDLFSSLTNEIGSDWKSYTPGVGYVLASDRAYFMMDTDGFIWRLVFTEYGGTATGTIGFNYVLENGVDGVNDPVNQVDFVLYPNPALRNQDFTLTANAPVQAVRVLDAAGRWVEVERSELGSNSVVVSTAGMACGFHIVEVQTENGLERSTLIVE